MKKELKQGLLCLLTYFVLTNTQYLLFQINGISIGDIPNFILSSYLIVYEILIIAIMLLIFRDKIVKDFADILKNHKDYFSKYFKYYLIGLMVMLLSNFFIIFILGKDISGNEESIRALLNTYPIYIYFSSVLYAPIVEELTFRQGIRNICGRNWIFVILSGLIFGGLHVITSFSSLTDLLYIIPYSSLGVVFAYILYKTDNIFISMGLHFMHNGILIAIQILTLLFS